MWRGTQSHGGLDVKVAIGLHMHSMVHSTNQAGVATWWTIIQRQPDKAIRVGKLWHGGNSAGMPIFSKVARKATRLYQAWLSGNLISNRTRHTTMTEMQHDQIYEGTYATWLDSPYYTGNMTSYTKFKWQLNTPQWRGNIARYTTVKWQHDW
jgi:hypothetical protein